MDTVSKTQTRLNTRINQAPNQKSGMTSPGVLGRGTRMIFEKGQTLHGVVTDIRNGQISIKLNNQAVLTAAYEGNQEVSIGQVASFKVTEANPGEQIKLKMNPSSVPAEEITIQKALEEASLPNTDRNAQVVRELLNNQLSINKQNILTILQHSASNPDVGIETFVLMQKHNIPITPDNATQFQQYRNGEYRLLSNMEQIGNELLSLLRESIQTGTSMDYQDYANQLLYFLVNHAVETTPSLDGVHDLSIVTLLPTQLEELVSILEPYSLSDQLRIDILNNKADIKAVMQSITESIGLARHNDLERISNLDTDAFQSSNSETTPPMTNEVDVFRNPIIYDLLDQHAALQHENMELSSMLDTQARQNLLQLLHDIPISKQQQDAIRNGNMTQKEFFSLLQNAMRLQFASELKPLFHSNEFKDLFSQSLLNNFTMEPKELTRDNALDIQYEKMMRQLDSLDQLSKSILTDQQTTTLNHQTDNMKQNFQFLETLNQIISYVQLPIRLRGQTVHSDLYIYTNKRALKNNSKSINVLLHLEMDHLGPLDININLVHNSIAARFYYSDADSNRIIQNNMFQLSEALNKKGYSFTSELIQREQEIDIVKDIIEKDAPVATMKRYSFDIRA